MSSSNNKNHQFCQETLQLKQRAEHTMLELGARLHKIKKEQLYKPFWSSFFEYELELKLQPSTVSRLIAIYKKFELELQIPRERLAAAGGWTALAEIEPIVKTKKDAEEWLEKVEMHTRADLRKDVQEAKDKLPGGKVHVHIPEEIYYLKIYGCCGLKESYYPESTTRRPGKGMRPIGEVIKKHHGH